MFIIKSSHRQEKIRKEGWLSFCFLGFHESAKCNLELQSIPAGKNCNYCKTSNYPELSGVLHSIKYSKMSTNKID
jgi:hypothetical protein